MFRRLSIGLLIILGFVLGYFREFVFESINAHLALQQMNSPSELSGILSIFNSFSPSLLYYTKFALTAFFALLFLLISLALIKAVFQTTKYFKWAYFFYLFVFGTSLVLFAMGKVIGLPEQLYMVSRYIQEIIQSPLASFMLIPAIYLYQKEKQA
ncbi:hypothetical protein KFE98_00865 [bacterium SCSIO 12741]|nr:hypothetical protein KFE98_00865 [bacterium SCSIO 12741]